jgi:hypothetical protein
MDLDQFVDGWKLKFDEEPPSWVRHLDDLEVELEECHSRIESLNLSLRKEEFLQVYLRQQIRAISRRSMMSDSERVEVESESVVSEDPSTELVETSTMDGSVGTLDDDGGRSPSLDNVSQCSSIIELARIIVEGAISEASRNCNDRYFQQELASSLPISEESEDRMDYEEEVEIPLPLHDPTPEKEEVRLPGTPTETHTSTITMSPEQPRTSSAACNRPDSKSSGEVAAAFKHLDDMLANVSPLASPEPVNSPRQLQTQQQLVSDHRLEVLKQIQLQQQQQQQQQQQEPQDLQRQHQQPQDLQQQQQQQDLQGQQQQKQQDMPQQVEQLQEKEEGEPKKEEGLLQQEQAGRVQEEGRQNAGQVPSQHDQETVDFTVKTEPLKDHHHVQQNGFTPAVIVEVDSDSLTPNETSNGVQGFIPRSPHRNSPRSQSKKRIHPPSPSNSTKRQSADGILKRGSSSRPGSGRKNSLHMYRVQSGPELDDISLLFDDVDEVDSDDPDLEHAVLSNLSETANAFYSILGSNSVHSLDDLDRVSEGLHFSSSTGNLLSEGDMAMKQYWESSSVQQVRRRRRSTQSSQPADDENAVSFGVSRCTYICTYVPYSRKISNGVNFCEFCKWPVYTKIIFMEFMHVLIFA